MRVLPPGNILQYMYVKRRLRKIRPQGRFLEIGSGKGNLSRILLNYGLTGVGVDLNSSATQKNREYNRAFVEAGKYEILEGDFLTQNWPSESFDFIVSAMVIEHIPHEELVGFMQEVKRLLSPNGRLMLLVPAGMQFWGIEDDIAGHIMRYEQQDFKTFADTHQLKLMHIAGLTYPLSNWFKRLSDLLVRRAEEQVLEMSQKDRTIYTGDREVSYKTEFPKFLGLVLNPVVMYPFYLLQLATVKSQKAMVLLGEFEK